MACLLSPFVGFHWKGKIQAGFAGLHPPAATDAAAEDKPQALQREQLLLGASSWPQVGLCWYRLAAEHGRTRCWWQGAVQCPSTQLALTPDPACLHPASCAGWTGLPFPSSLVSFGKFQIPNWDLNGSHFQRPIGTVWFSSQFLKASCSGQWFCHTPSRACCRLCMFTCANLQALSFEGWFKLDFPPFFWSCFEKPGWAGLGFLAFPAAAGARALSFSLANHSGYDHCLW